MEINESENEDLREQLKHQGEIIDSLVEMKNVLKTQIALEKEIMKQNLMNEHTFIVNIDTEELEEDTEVVEDYDKLVRDNICLETENKSLKELLEQLNEDKDYLVEKKIENRDKIIVRNKDLRRMSFNSMVDERQIYEDVIEGKKIISSNICCNVKAALQPPHLTLAKKNIWGT